MEGNSSSGHHMMPIGLPKFQHLQESVQLHHNQSPKPHQHVPPVQTETLSLCAPIVPSDPFYDHSRGEIEMCLSGKDDEMKSGESIDGHADVADGKMGSPWQRSKWTENMVKLLITALSYIGGGTSSDCFGGERRKSSITQKMGKWKCISRVMVQRGFYVSPQQCEDKFNDMNKRYKRLVDLLGRGTSCQVVENPSLLDVIDIPKKAKEDVRKILSSKHLFYEQMCSYHNKNRLFLPHDPDLQRSLHLLLWGNDDYGTHQLTQEDTDDFLIEAQGAGLDVQCDRIETSAKRLKPTNQTEVQAGVNPSKGADCNGGLYANPGCSDVNASQNNQMALHLLELKEQKRQIIAWRLRLKQKEMHLQMKNSKQDKELDKMRLENEQMRLENEYLAIELKLGEMRASKR